MWSVGQHCWRGERAIAGFDKPLDIFTLVCKTYIHMSQADNNAQVLKGLLDALVLDFLRTKDSYGLEILQSVHEALGEERGLLKEKSLYPLLHRLENNELLEAYWKPGSRGTDRKYYRITKAGRQFLDQRVADWHKVVGVLSRTILKDAGGK